MNPMWKGFRPKFDVMVAIAVVIALFIVLIVLFGPHR